MTHSDDSYPPTPKGVPPVQTRYREIQTKIPVPDSIPLLRRLAAAEPLSMRGQPPVVWDRAEGVNVFDKWGNKWLDFSSGVLVANAGHARQEIQQALLFQVSKPLHHNYCFPSEIRLDCCEKILSVAPNYLDKVFLLTTGSEATECAMKLARTWGHETAGSKKNTIVSFENAFHGRTLGAQMMGGIPGLKEWIVYPDPDMVQVPFPDGFWNENTSFALFEETLREKGVNPANVAGVISETYQGGGADFFPPEYVQQLRSWCSDHDALLIFDEVQAGFGRTGTWWGFEHYGVEPDLVCMGKGITSGLPGSGVLGRHEIMDLYPPGSMTSTHTGNPLTCAAIIANIDLILKENLVEHAARVGQAMHHQLQAIVDAYEIFGACHGKGLVAGLQVVNPEEKEPDKDLAGQICTRIVEKGLLLFAPVGRATLKISPPLCIPEEAISEGCEVIAEATKEVLAEASGGR